MIRIDGKRSMYDAVILLAFVIVINLSILSSFFPLNEAWWEFYSWLNLSVDGKLYEKYKIYFPPFHIFISGILFKLSNNNLMVDRLLGLILPAVSIVTIYYTLIIRFSKSSAFIGAIFSIFLEFSFNSAYVIRDYQTTVLILLTLVTFGIVQISKKLDNFAYFSITGLSLSALALTKQNVFVGALIPSLIFFLYARAATGLIITIVSFLVFQVIFLYLYGVGIYQPYFANEAKGSPLVFLTRVFVNRENILLIAEAIIIAIILAGTNLVQGFTKYIQLFTKQLDKQFINSDYRFILSGKNYYVLILVFLAPFFLGEKNIILVTLSVVFFELINGGKFSQRVKNRPELLIFISNTYFVTFTAGLCYSNMVLVISYSLAYILNKINFNYNRYSKYLFVVCLATAAVIIKLQTPYAWWGYANSPITSSNRCFKDIELMKGLCVDDDHYQIIINSHNIIGNSKNIFAYPSIPIFYLMNNSVPEYRLPIQWFDVSSAADAPQLLKDLQRNRPDYILWLRPPSSVYMGHYDLRRQESLVNITDKILYNYLNEASYHIVYQKTISDKSVKFYESEENIKNLPPLVSMLESIKVNRVEYKNYKNYLEIADLEKRKLDDHYQFIILKKSE